MSVYNVTVDVVKHLVKTILKTALCTFFIITSGIVSINSHGKMEIWF